MACISCRPLCHFHFCYLPIFYAIIYSRKVHLTFNDSFNSSSSCNKQVTQNQYIIFPVISEVKLRLNTSYRICNSVNRAI